MSSKDGHAAEGSAGASSCKALLKLVRDNEAAVKSLPIPASKMLPKPRHHGQSFCKLNSATTGLSSLDQQGLC